jgi:hypothetical protein
VGADRARLNRAIPCCEPALLQEGKSGVPAESAPLLGLAKAKLVLDLQSRRPVKTATLDIDATVIACDKRTAKRAGACPRAAGGRQSRLSAGVGAVDGRTGRDHCRRVSATAMSRAARAPRRVVKALAALPGGLDKIYLRGDSALYEHELMRSLDAKAIGYAIWPI